MGRMVWHRISPRWLRGLLLGLGFLAVVVLLMVWLAGGFHRKIGHSRGSEARLLPEPGQLVSAGLVTAEVVLRTVPRIETAVGTVRAVQEMSLASKLLARVTEVQVTAGQRVSASDILVRLDDADLLARADQAGSAVAAARSTRDQAKIEYDRILALRNKGAASQIEWDRVQSALQTAEAELNRAEQAADEADIVATYATIKSPIDGVVIDKHVEVGDMVTPGQVLLTLYDPTRMQLVASVRESLAQRLRVGQTVGVKIETLEHTCDGRVSEIVPQAESASRAFSVKVTGPCPPGVYSGMFGRLLIPLDAETVPVIPQSAVIRIGQLELVDVVHEGRLQRRAVTLGRTFDSDVEVLSGLREGEVVALDSAGGSRTDGQR